MAKIGIENIETLSVNVVPTERTVASEGDLAVHALVAAEYQKKKYDEKPKSEEEADARGENGFNGLMSSFPSIHADPTSTGNVVEVTIAPTRYFMGEALRDLAKSGTYTPEQLSAMSPDMANVSLVVPVKIKGHYFLMAQIKGRKTLNSGAIHAAMVAGNIDAKYLSHPDPLTVNLQNECSEEVGMDLSGLDPTAALYLVDERETGQVNFAYLARNADADNILNAYEASVKQKLAASEKLEVMALAQLPVAGFALVPLPDGSSSLKDILCFHPTGEGLVQIVETRGVRPYTQATLDYLSKPENVAFLLEKAGF